MICPTCSTETAHIKVEIDGSVVCHKCGGFSQTGGSKTDKVLTRNASRITEQQIQYEADIIPPYKLDKNTRQVVPNEDFMELYPNQAVDTFTQDELIDAGYGGLKKHQKNDDKGIKFKGRAQDAIKNVVDKNLRNTT